MLALKDSFVGKDGFSNCGEHASGFMITEGLFLGLEKANYEPKVMILLKTLKIPITKLLTNFKLCVSWRSDQRFSLFYIYMK